MAVSVSVISMRAESEELRRAANGANIQGPEPSGHARMPLLPGYSNVPAGETTVEGMPRVRIASRFSAMLRLPQQHIHSGSSDTR